MTTEDVDSALGLRNVEVLLFTAMFSFSLCGRGVIFVCLDEVMCLFMWFLKYLGAFFSLVVYFCGVYAIIGYYV